MKKILIIAAHPDDEIIGCGGTIAKYTQEGNEVYICIVCEGTTGRYEEKYFLTPEERTIDITNEIKRRESAAKESAKLLGVKEIQFMNFPNLELHSTPYLKVNKMLEDYINRIKPDIVFTHTKYDNNIDHISTYSSSIIATRDINEVITYEIVGSTTNRFIPNMFVNIEDTYQIKQKALECYQNEMKPYPQPRSMEGIEILAKYRGINSCNRLAEAFDIIKKIQ